VVLEIVLLAVEGDVELGHIVPVNLVDTTLDGVAEIEHVFELLGLIIENRGLVNDRTETVVESADSLRLKHLVYCGSDDHTSLEGPW